MDSTSQLVAGMLFGAVGMGYLLYARRQRSGIAFIAGVGLCVFPYFVTNFWLMILVGIACMALPFAMRYWP